MNKQKFEAYLRDKLSILQQEEIDEIVAEYLQHIDMRVAEGVSEEEAIADFGDLDELVNDLLDAYKINRNERDFERFENRVKLGLNNAMDFINRIANSIMRRSSNQVISLIVEFIIVIFVVFLINSFIQAVFSGFNSAFYFRPYFLTSLIRLIIGLVRVAISTSLSIAIFYWFAKERVLNKDERNNESFSDYQEPQQRETQQAKQSQPKKQEQPKQAEQPRKEQPKPASSETVNFTMNDQASVVDNTVASSSTESKHTVESDPVNKTYVEPQVQPKPQPKPQPQARSQKTFAQKLLSFNVTILRIFVALCLIPGIVVGVLMGIGYVMLLFATLSGYGSIGLVILFSGGILIYYYFMILFIKFVGGRRA